MTNWLDQTLADAEHSSRLRNDLPYFCEHVLKLRTKAGPIEPFILNAAQKKLHTAIEEQKAKIGRVRVVVLKARQLGVSTYAAARLFHRTIYNAGLRTIIVAQDRRASGNLFGIVKRFYDLMPEDIKPSVGVSNTEELLFDKIDSGYIVVVATTEGTGRSATAQMLHASEVAFWSDLPIQMAALGETVADINNTEIILESTANGYNEWHSLWRKAEAGQSDYAPIFLPWSLDEQYRREVGPDFEMDSSEKALAELHGLDKQQVCWRRAKMLGSAERFSQEYPLMAAEAFISSDFDSFISPGMVLAARKEELAPFEDAPLIVGCDPAGMGPDRTSIAWRQGRCITKIESRRGLDTMEVAGWLQKINREDKPAKILIDVGGLGVGVYDRLREQGLRNVEAINFGGKPVSPPPLDQLGNPAGGAANRRAELWSNMKTALQEGRFSLPDSDSLQADLTSCGYKYDSAGRLLIESKQDMRRRGVPSPDEGDAVALTFSDPEGYVGAALTNFHRKIEYPDAWSSVA